MDYETIRKANEAIGSVDVQGRDYVMVNQRVKAFRMVYPDGFIRTSILNLENGMVVFKASVGYRSEDGREFIVGEGTAYEKENSTFINKTSYIENCETSAVGRALGMAGFGIDASMASAEEVQNALLNQKKQSAPAKQTKQTPPPQPTQSPAAQPTLQMPPFEIPDSKDQLALMLEGLGADLRKVYVAYKKSSLEEMTVEDLKQAYIRKYNAMNKSTKEVQ